MKKTLLIAAAALAAGVISSQAQGSVYSQNIVGYVNTPLILGYSAICNPLDNPSGNTLTNIIPNVPVGGAGPFDGATVYIWTGTGYNIVTLDSTQPTGVGDANDINPVASPLISPGQLFYLNNNTASALTNTFVGNVHVEGAGAGSIGVTTNTLNIGYSFVSSKLPIAGGVTTVLGLTNTIVGGNGILDGATLYTPHIVGGAFLGYNIVTFDSGQPTGFGDANDINPVGEPVIPVGGGFIFNNNTAGAINWVQSF